MLGIHFNFKNNSGLYFDITWTIPNDKILYK
jgi:hypothetical protein